MRLKASTAVSSAPGRVLAALGRHDRRMAEALLHDLQVGATRQQP
jgi:hypothetical protein